MRNLIIDTDTGSDDAIAIVMALREKSVKVVGITTVMGNVPLEIATRNALISIEQAKSYDVPVYKGLGKPLNCEPISAEDIHGNDGLGDVGYKVQRLSIEEEHGVDAMIRMVKECDGEIEIVTLGPLTNVAAAIIRDRETMSKVKQLIIMGGVIVPHIGYSATAEFNILVDVIAADIVFKSGIPFLLAPLELGRQCLLGEEEYTRLNKVSNIGEFFVQCNKTMIGFIEKKFGFKAIGMADPTAMAVGLHEDIMDEVTDCYVAIETKGEYTYGQTVCDFEGKLGKTPNGRVCSKINVEKFKRFLFETAKI